MASENDLCLSLVRARDRSFHLLRRVARAIQEHEGDDLAHATIAYCTEHTLASCTSIHFCLPSFLDQFSGGFLFFFWLLTSGPKWVVTMLKERNQVCSAMLGLTMTSKLIRPLP